jgi:serine/threonine protein kinase/Tol biopolymer transport system component
MSLAAGARIGHYVIASQIGAGGMGEVYRATDTRLKRDVAVKTLPGGLAGDSERLARFEREAQLLASLNHPNIAQIYGFERAAADPAHGEAWALVMELVEGPTLADRIVHGPIPADEALAIARQIADALQAAHDQGIVHRDHKPANVKVRSDGVVKVLDFGLAKLRDAADSEAATTSMASTITSPAMTRAGVILGTAAYMSPEQARGQAVDRRADIWAFGCVLYEMLSGTRAFVGDTLTDVLAAVVSSEPDLSRVPPHVRALLTRCLEKDARRRLRDIGDAMFLLDASAHASESSMPAAASRRSPPLLWAGLAIATVSAISLAFVHFREPVHASLPTRVQMVMPDGTVANAFSVSPDGGSLLLRLQTGGATRLALRSVRTGELRELPGTAGAGPGIWSRDGRAIAFPIQGALKTISAAGGAPETLVDGGVGVTGHGGFGCWANGEIVFQNDRGGFSRVSETGGEPTVLTVVAPARGEVHHESASCLPDGRFLYFRHLQEEGASGIYAGATNLPPDKQSLTPVLVADDGLFVPGRDETRHQLLFRKGGTLFAQDFSPDRLELTGETRHLADNVSSETGSVWFTATDGGVLVFRNAVDSTSQLTWLDREGRVSGTLDDYILLGGLRIAPDGTRAAVGRLSPDSGDTGIWIAPFAGGPMARLTSATTREAGPVWSPDGTRVAFVLFGGEQAVVHQQAVNSTTSEPLSSPMPLFRGFSLTDWLKDGRFILMTGVAAQTRSDVWIVPVVPGGTTPRDPIPLLQTMFSETTAVFSPDRRWIAYVSDESGRSEVYVRRFLVLPDGAPSAPESSKRMISNGAREAVRWRRDGRELLYLGADGRMMAADVDSGGELRVGPPRPLFTVPPEYLRNQPGAGVMDMLPDASRFLLGMPRRQAPRTDLEVILNWR